MLSELRAERAQIEEAISVLQRIASGQGRRRGRPPKWMSPATGASDDSASPVSGKRRRRKPFSAATRRKMAESQKARWAAKRKVES